MTTIFFSHSRVLDGEREIKKIEREKRMERKRKKERSRATNQREKVNLERIDKDENNEGIEL